MILLLSQTSPLTRQPLNPNALRPNLALKASIDRWKQSKKQESQQVMNPVSTYPYQYQPSYQPAPYMYPPPIPTAPPVTQSVYATTAIVPIQRPPQIQTQQPVTLSAEQKKRAMRIVCVLMGLVVVIVIVSSIINTNRNRTSRYADDDT